jgi:hypothetical protein
MKSELKSGRPFWAFIGTLVLIMSYYFDATGWTGISNVLLFTGCFIFGAVFQSVRQEKKDSLPLED